MRIEDINITQESVEEFFDEIDVSRAVLNCRFSAV